MLDELTWAWLYLFFGGFLMALLLLWAVQFIYDKVTGLFMHYR
jgi:hypothetical protein